MIKKAVRAQFLQSWQSMPMQGNSWRKPETPISGAMPIPVKR